MPHLLAITVGPVESFIAAARRTRDFWSGSTLLSDISKVAASVIHAAEPGCLIFPNPQNPAQQLVIGSDFLVANVILARLETTDPAQTARECQKAAQDYFQKVADRARSEVSEQHLNTHQWNQQRGEPLEFYAAWTSLETESYADARAVLMRTLAARKACRDFQPWAGTPRISKSSLDGKRESIWKGGKVPTSKALGPSLSARLRLSPGEHLDLLGLVKRIGLGNAKFPSVRRVAAQHWLHKLSPADLTSLNAAAAPLAGSGLISYPEKSRFPQFQNLPFESAAVFLRDLNDLVKENPHANQSAIADLRRCLGKLYSTYNPPSPYLGILLADGDRMGATIASIKTHDDHKQFSAALSRFASQAKQIIESHGGSLVFAGGDDVLAFVPVHQILSAAWQLQECFKVTLHAWADPTLSVGVSIGHSMEPLADLFQQARATERAAKLPDRNGFAVGYFPRHQQGITWRSRWTDPACSNLQTFHDAFVQDLMPDSFAYDVGLIEQHYRLWSPRDQNLAPAIQADLRRVLLKKKLSNLSFRNQLDQACTAGIRVHSDLQTLSRSLRVARAIANAGELR